MEVFKFFSVLKTNNRILKINIIMQNINQHLPVWKLLQIYKLNTTRGWLFHNALNSSMHDEFWPLKIIWPKLPEFDFFVTNNLFSLFIEASAIRKVAKAFRCCTTRQCSVRLTHCARRCRCAACKVTARRRTGHSRPAPSPPAQQAHFRAAPAHQCWTRTPTTPDPIHHLTPELTTTITTGMILKFNPVKKPKRCTFFLIRAQKH